MPDPQPIETTPSPREGYLPYRRRPQLRSFLVVGALIGAVLGVLLAVLGPDVEGSSLAQQVVLLGAIGALLGGFLASIAYLVADRQTLRG